MKVFLNKMMSRHNAFTYFLKIMKNLKVVYPKITRKITHMNLPFETNISVTKLPFSNK